MLTILHNKFRSCNSYWWKYLFIDVVAFPAPLMFGLVIDATCRVHQSLCGGKGACLLYDSEEMRIGMHGFASSVKVLSTFLYVLAWYIASRARKIQKKKQERLKASGLEIKPLVNEKLEEDRQENKNVETL